MYNIEVTDYGMKHTFSGVLEDRELERWYEESKRVLSSFIKPFSMVLDMRDAKPLGHHAEVIFCEGINMIEEYGMKRRAIIMENPVITGQIRQISKIAKAVHKERYIDAVTTRNWKKLSQDWVVSGIDPDRL